MITQSLERTKGEKETQNDSELILFRIRGGKL